MRIESVIPEDRLRVGERGYYTQFGETWPARVVANDIAQTFGPIDELIAVTKWPGHECIVRLVLGREPHSSGHWLSKEAHDAAEGREMARQAKKLLERAGALA